MPAGVVDRKLDRVDSSPIATISAAHRSGERSLVRGKRAARPDVPERSNQRANDNERSERRISAQAGGAPKRKAKRKRLDKRPELEHGKRRVEREREAQ